MDLMITRHGQVQINVEGYIESVDFPKGDPSITPLGEKQAALLGERLRDMDFQIYSSPYIRTVKTACLIARASGKRVTLHNALREIVKTKESVVNFTGRTLGELAKEFEEINSSPVLPYPWWEGEEESIQDVVSRVSPFVYERIRAGENCLLVGHGASAWAAVRAVFTYFSLPLPELGPIWNCSLTRFVIANGICRVESLNDVSHIPGQLVTSNQTHREGEGE